MSERHEDHDIEDLETRCRDLRQQFKNKLELTSQAANDVKVKKSMLKSGKHIDAFFDGLIKEVLSLHASVKERYRL